MAAPTPQIVHFAVTFTNSTTTATVLAGIQAIANVTTATVESITQG